MRKGYNIGHYDDPVILRATIGTPGIANTKVFQFFGDGQNKLLAESDHTSGNIEDKTIGIGSELVGTYIKIRSIIDFGTFEEGQWEQLFENLVGRYGLSGGIAGPQSYSYDDDDKTKSSSGRFVVLDMELDLKA